MKNKIPWGLHYYLATQLSTPPADPITGQGNKRELFPFHPAARKDSARFSFYFCVPQQHKVAIKYNAKSSGGFRRYLSPEAYAVYQRLIQEH